MSSDGISPASKLFQLQNHGQRALELAVEVRFVAVELLQTMHLQPFAKGLRLDRRGQAGFLGHASTDGLQRFADELLQALGGRRVFLFLDLLIPPVAQNGRALVDGLTDIRPLIGRSGVADDRHLGTDARMTHCDGRRWWPPGSAGHTAIRQFEHRHLGRPCRARGSRHPVAACPVPPSTSRDRRASRGIGSPLEASLDRSRGRLGGRFGR